jgi:hypothetical protein
MEVFKMKALLLSVKPEHAYNILNGKKTLELRTWIPKNYKGWVYVACSKAKPYLYELYNRFLTSNERQDYDGFPTLLNGKVVCRFWFDDYSFMEFFEDDFVIDGAYDYNQLFQDGVHPKDMCLTNKELEQYGKGKPLYAWHIKRLEIFPKAKELGEFAKLRKSMKQENKYYLTKAPQKMAYVFVKEE